MWLYICCCRHLFDSKFIKISNSSVSDGYPAIATSFFLAFVFCPVFILYLSIFASCLAQVFPPALHRSVTPFLALLAPGCFKELSVGALLAGHVQAPLRVPSLLDFVQVSAFPPILCSFPLFPISVSQHRALGVASYSSQVLNSLFKPQCCFLLWMWSSFHLIILESKETAHTIASSQICYFFFFFLFAVPLVVGL